MASPSPFTSLKPQTPFHLHPSLQHRSNRFPMEFARNAVLAPCSALSPPPCLFLRPAALRFRGGRRLLPAAAAASPEKDEFGGKNRLGMANSNYVVPLDVPTPGLVRPLAEILRDLNRRVSEKIISPGNNSVPWYHANRMLSFYAPGWCGEVRDVIFSDDRSVTVVYRVTIRGSDGEAHRESTGTVSLRDNQLEDPVTAAEELAFCRACARFGFGLHLYHED